MNVHAYLEQWLQRQWSKKGLYSLLTRPLSALTARYVQQLAKKHPLYADLTRPPVIVVGNIIVGGAGKTPVVLAICEYLKKHGWQPGIISRGYGVDIGPEPRVGQGELDAALFGDEPALLAQQSQAPIAVHPKRKHALAALCAAYPQVDVVIADDGLQHRSLARDIEVIVQDQRGIANGLLLPAGPLREPAHRLQRADWLITQLPPQQDVLPHTPQPLDLSHCVTMRLWPHHFVHLASGTRLDTERWLERYGHLSCSALAAIGQPQRFFAMLEHSGIHLDQGVALADHHTIAASTFSRLTSEILLITAKDAVKCSDLNDQRVWVVYAQPQFDPSNWLDRLLLQLQQHALLR